ncbi:hypothetical protein FALCPG4_001617 [Fusarium falciforme]
MAMRRLPYFAHTQPFTSSNWPRRLDNMQRPGDWPRLTLGILELGFRVVSGSNYWAETGGTMRPAHEPLLVQVSDDKLCHFGICSVSPHPPTVSIVVMTERHRSTTAKKMAAPSC